MIFSYLLNMQSHPSWVCGLKHIIRGRNIINITSHPSWVCGLKQLLDDVEVSEVRSHPSWVCGLKQLIEQLDTMTTESHPSWVCGLKHTQQSVWIQRHSHTLRGCVDWNCQLMCQHLCIVVTPFVGVWIETRRLPVHCSLRLVTPFVGVWIETQRVRGSRSTPARHTLRGCVDWNTNNHRHDQGQCSSHPSWVCGLKLIVLPYSAVRRSHTLRGCVDWNLSLLEWQKV